VTCAICGLVVGTGLYRDGKGDPVHHWCREIRVRVQAAAEAIKATGTPPRAKRQSTRRVRR